MMREQTTQYNKEISVREEPKMRHPRRLLQEPYGSSYCFFSSPIGRIACFTGPLDGAPPLLIVKLDPNLPGYIRAPSSQDCSQDSVRINSPEAKIRVYVFRNRCDRKVLMGRRLATGVK